MEEVIRLEVAKTVKISQNDKKSRSKRKIEPYIAKFIIVEISTVSGIHESECFY